MELILPTLAATPWMGSVAGFAFAVSSIAVLITLAVHAGLYYSIPRSLMKLLGQCALRRMS
jgi:hypothetical protein